MANDANTMKVVDLLVQVANLDTVYRDLHLRHARQLLSPTLDEFAYRALGSAEKDIDDLTRRSRTAVLQRDDQLPNFPGRSRRCAGSRQRCAAWLQPAKRSMKPTPWCSNLFHLAST